MTDRVITVDGPAGVGKTTLGRRLALTLGLPLIDTGLFYRGLMVAAVRAGIAVAERDQLASLATRTRIEPNTDASAEGTVLVDGSDAGSDLRDPAHAALLSTMSQIPDVRHALLAAQRNAARAGGVAVGRDCGTVVYPHALVKLYLQAPVSLRIQRRGAELRDGDSATSDVSTRDRIDAPSMERADDAHLLDTGELDIAATLAEALRICAAAGITARQ